MAPGFPPVSRKSRAPTAWAGRPLPSRLAARLIASGSPRLPTTTREPRARSASSRGVRTVASIASTISTRSVASLRASTSSPSIAGSSASWASSTRITCGPPRDWRASASVSASNSCRRAVPPGDSAAARAARSNLAASAGEACFRTDSSKRSSTPVGPSGRVTRRLWAGMPLARAASPASASRRLRPLPSSPSRITRPPSPRESAATASPTRSITPCRPTSAVSGCSVGSAALMARASSRYRSSWAPRGRRCGWWASRRRQRSSRCGGTPASTSEASGGVRFRCSSM